MQKIKDVVFVVGKSTRIEYNRTMKSDTIAKKLGYIKVAVQSNKTDIALYATDELSRKENVSEHTFSISLIFWTFKEDLIDEFPELNISRVYDMIQIHDLAEIYSSDISTWIHRDKDKKKAIDEEDAIAKLSLYLPESKSKDLKDLFHEFEEMKSIEAKVVKGIDRLSHAIQRLITKQGWKKENHNERDLDSIQLPRVSFSKTLLEVYELLKEEAKGSNLL